MLSKNDENEPVRGFYSGKTAKAMIAVAEEMDSIFATTGERYADGLWVAVYSKDIGRMSDFWRRVEAKLQKTEGGE